MISEFVGYSEMSAIELYGKWFNTYAYILLEYCPNGTVLDLLMKANKLGRKISLKLQKYLFRSTILSLYELMSLSGLNHCDIKPDNIMLDDDLQCRLFDYGHASKVGQTLYHVTGTYQYAAPEIHYSIPY